MAVGSTFPNDSKDPDSLAEAWNGKGWKVVSTPTPTGSVSNQLSGVSCTSATCLSVGNYALQPPQPPIFVAVNYPLAETLGSGKFTIVPTVGQGSPTTTVSPGITWLSKSCPNSRAELEDAGDLKRNYLYTDWN